VAESESLALSYIAFDADALNFQNVL